MLTCVKRKCFLAENFCPARWMNVIPIHRLTNGLSGQALITATYSPDKINYNINQTLQRIGKTENMSLYL